MPFEDKPIKVGLAQIPCSTELPIENVQTIIVYARNAAECGGEVVIFPMMSDTGYQPSTIPNVADTRGEAAAKLASVAAHWETLI